MPFSPKTMEFLFENCLNDSKEWFNAHRSDYEEYVRQPFKDFITDLTPTMQKIDKKLICDPKRLSRIYRDARYSKGKSIFRDNVWYTFSRTKEAFHSLPSFYFGISPAGFEYGCGYYYAGTDTMNAIRRLILEGDISFAEAKAAYNKQTVFTLHGDMYKRDHYPQQSEENRFWLNRRDIWLSFESKDYDALYSKDLCKTVAADFIKIADIYKFFMKAEQIREL